MTAIFGIVGWKNSGKTTLTARLIEEFTRRGLKVSAVKHAHHGFNVDQPGRDSYRFREAGAREVAVVSAKRVAIMQELRGEEEPGLDAILTQLSGSDLILVEGFKGHDHPKIEVRRQEATQCTGLGDAAPRVVAIAADHETDAGGLPCFALDDIHAIANFIAQYLELQTAAG